MAINDISSTPYASILGQKDLSRALRTDGTSKQEGAERTKKDDTVTLSGDRVTMSSASLLVQVGVDVAAKSSDVRQSKVDSLKELVKSGKYEMNSTSIADKLISSELELDRYL